MSFTDGTLQDQNRSLLCLGLCLLGQIRLLLLTLRLTRVPLTAYGIWFSVSINLNQGGLRSSLYWKFSI